MVMTVEKYTFIRFKQRHEFESTDFDQWNIVLLINRSFNKYFSRRDNNLKAIIDRVWFHPERRLLKDPVILKKSWMMSNFTINNT